MTRIVQGAALLLLPIVTLPAGAGVPAIHGLAIPSGLADPGGRTGYVSGGRGGVEAIDLVTGDLLWKVKDADRALLLIDHRLIVRVPLDENRIKLRVLDVTRGGAELLTTDAITFPGWVALDNRPGHSFEQGWCVEAHQVLLHWRAKAWYVGAALLTPEEEEARRKQAEGSVAVSLTTGEVSQEARAAREETPAYLFLDQLQKLAVRWHSNADGKLRVVAVRREDDKEKVILYRWTPPEKKPELECTLMEGERVQTLITEDGRYIALRRPYLTPENSLHSPTRDEDAWSFFSLDTGREVGRAPHEPGIHAIALVPPRALFLRAGGVLGPLQGAIRHQRTLEAADLPTGKKLWKHPVAGH